MHCRRLQALLLMQMSVPPCTYLPYALHALHMHPRGKLLSSYPYCSCPPSIAVATSNGQEGAGLPGSVRQPLLHSSHNHSTLWARL